jgi:hypothetical protein
MLKKSFIILILLFLLVSIQGFAQASNAAILKTYIDVKKVNSNTVGGVVTKLSSIYNIPIGIELIYKETKKNQQTSNLLKKNGSLKMILDQLINERKEYDWVNEKDSIFVFPREKDSEVTDFLTYRFDDVKFDFSDDRVDVSGFVFEIPGVIERLKRLKLQPLSLTKISGTTYETLEELEKVMPNNSIELKNISVKELLYKLLKEGKIKFWYVARWGAKREFISIVTS